MQTKFSALGLCLLISEEALDLQQTKHSYHVAPLHSFKQVKLYGGTFSQIQLRRKLSICHAIIDWLCRMLPMPDTLFEIKKIVLEEFINNEYTFQKRKEKEKWK